MKDTGYRMIIMWRLWEAMPRTNRLVAHREGPRFLGASLCGRLGPGSAVTLHRTVAEAIGADECKSCVKAAAR